MNLEKVAAEYVSSKEHLKALTDRTNELKSILAKAVEEGGTPDDKGHLWFAAGNYQLQRQKRQGDPYLDKDAAWEWAFDRGIIEDVTRTEVVLDEDALASWVFEHRHDKTIEQEYKGLFVTPEPTWAFMAPQEGKVYDY